MDPDGAPSRVARHQFAASSFTRLSLGEGTPDITNGFLVTELSRRKLLLVTLVQQIIEKGAVLGPLCTAEEADDQLVAAEVGAPNAFSRLLLDPGVGSGLAYALRRLRGGARGDVPLWVDLGVVHALAVAAASRAGLSWSTALPVRDGGVLIPTMGMARFPAEAGRTVEARVWGGRIRLSGNRRELLVPSDATDVNPVDDGPGWWALRGVQIGDDLRLRVWIDDLDWHRDLADPIPPARLDDEAFERWRRQIDDGWRLLCRDHRAEAEAMVDGVTSIVPLKRLDGQETRSASNGEAFGSVMLDEPPDAVTMAVSLVHEYKHIQLGALLHLIALTEPDDGSLYYAPWRDDPRPLPGLIQGVYAFVGIADFWRVRRDKVTGPDHDLAAFEYSIARRQVRESLRIMLAAPGLTAKGHEFYRDLRGRVEEWAPEPDQRIEDLAELTADIHQVGWRLRHFEPQGEDVVALAEQLLRREGPSVKHVLPAALRPHPTLLWKQRIPSVARRHVVAGASGVATGDDMLARAENFLVARDTAAALEAYLGVLARISCPDTAGPPDEDARAWAGLAASLKAEGNSAAAAALAHRPDLVRAVYTELTASGSAAPTPVEVAGWLAPVLSD